MILAANKSTNVRVSSTLPAVRAVLRGLTAIAPGASAQLAARWFMTPRRFARPNREAVILKSAVPIAVPLNGSRIVRAWRWGEAPFVLLAHGWEGRGAQLGDFVEPLRTAGYGVVTYDAPAHGDSPGRESGPAMFGDALAAVARWFGTAHGLVAHSMGALATPWALRRGLSVNRVVFIAPGFSPDVATQRMADVLDLPPSVLDKMRQHISTRTGRPWRSVADETMRGIREPMLVIHDANDKEVPIATAERWVNVSAEARLSRTTGLGHRRILRNPEVIAEAVAFLGAPPAVKLDPWQQLMCGAFDIDRPAG